MQRTVEILLVIGILVNLIKGADLLLRTHQQKWLQDKFETLTLKLDYTRPLDWYMKGGKAVRLYWLLWMAAPLLTGIIFLPFREYYLWFLLLAFVNITTYARDYKLVFAKPRTEAQLQRLDNRLKKRGASGIRIERKFSNWIMGSPTYGQHLFRRFALTILSIIVVLLLMTIMEGLTYVQNLILSRNNWPSYILFAIYIYFVLQLCFRYLYVALPILFIGIIGFIILICSTTILIAEVLLRILRGIAWRIAEYNKGAFAAIVLLVTIALGIAELYFKTQPPPVSPQATPVQTAPSPPGTSQSP